MSLASEKERLMRMKNQGSCAMRRWILCAAGAAALLGGGRVTLAGQSAAYANAQPTYADAQAAYQLQSQGQSDAAQATADAKQRDLDRQQEARDREQEKVDREQERQERLQELYDDGRGYLDEENYGDAEQKFAELASMNGPQTDAALYWKAYAENRQGKREAALASTAELRKRFPQSRW